MNFLDKSDFIEAAACDVFCEPDEVVAIRIVKDENKGEAFREGGDQAYSHFVDGVAADGVPTEAVWNFATRQEAIDAIPGFCREAGIYGIPPVQDETGGK